MRLAPVCRKADRMAAVAQVAPFYSDASLLATGADGEYAGDVNFRLSDSESSEADAAAALVQRAFNSGQYADWQPAQVLIATW
jgi:hypothetical protein